MATPVFDLRRLFRAVDAERARHGLSWAALVASYGFTTAGADWAEGMTWGVPRLEVAIIVTIAITSTLVAALWPARRAAGIQPAIALRIAD